MIDIFIRKIKNDPSLKRHLLKTITWRIIGSLDTVFLGWLITGKIAMGLKIGGLELFTKMLFYFLHERAWYKIKFGLQTREDKAEKVKKKNAPQLFEQSIRINKQEKQKLNGHKSFTLWFTGLPASGKSTIAVELDAWFYARGYRSTVLDGDNTRLGINSDLSFSKEDRRENIRRVAEISRLFNEAGIITIASFIAPFEEERAKAKSIIGFDDFIEVFVDASVDTCKSRDRKGLYALAAEGKLKNFTGINSPYEKPTTPDIHLHTDVMSINESVTEIISYLQKQNIIKGLEKLVQ